MQDDIGDAATGQIRRQDMARLVDGLHAEPGGEQRGRYEEQSEQSQARHRSTDRRGLSDGT